MGAMNLREKFARRPEIACGTHGEHAPATTDGVCLQCLIARSEADARKPLPTTEEQRTPNGGRALWATSRE